MADIIIYTKESCHYCTLAKELFNHYNASFKEIRVDLDNKELENMIRLSNRRTVPQIFINGQSIGGYDDLALLAKSGKLVELLKT